MGLYWQQGILGVLGRKQGAASEVRARTGESDQAKGLDLQEMAANPSQEVHGGQGNSSDLGWCGALGLVQILGPGLQSRGEGSVVYNVRSCVRHG